ncbi:MAG: trigger factor [Steroidobacteraceae bacterium]|nr:trigger factor [Steroidobacteraceae bacterium]
MMVSVQVLSGLERRMEVSVPATRVEQQVDARLIAISRDANIKGFRKGRAPIHVIKQRFGLQAREDVLNELIRTTFTEAVQRESLMPAGGPRIEPLSAGKGEDLRYAAVFEVYPEVAVQGVDGMALMRPTAEVAEADVDAMIDSLRKQRPNFVATARGCQDGDRVTVDFDGTLDGEAFAGGKAENFVVQLGAGRMLKGFEDGIRGVAAGETRTFPVEFPPQYPAANLAGKTAQFTAVVKTVEEQQLPEVDDEFCKAFGVFEGGIEALRAEVRENMQRELAQNVRARLKSQVMDKLVAANPIDLPRTLIEAEIRDMQTEILRRMQQQGGRPQGQLPPKEQFEAGARRRVALGLVLNELIKSAGITVDMARVEQRLDELVASYADPADARNQYLQNEGAMRQLQMVVLEDQVVDYVLGRAQVTDQPATFKDIMNFGAAEAS